MDIFTSRRAAPMLIGAEAEAFDDPEYVYELKLDGERCLAYLDPSGETELINKRKRRVLPLFPELAELNRQVRARCILDGELIIAGADGRPEFEAVLRRSNTSARKRIEQAARQNPAAFVAYDVLFLNDTDITDRPLVKRRSLLEAAVMESDCLALSRTYKQGTALFRLTVEQGLEGVVAKREKGPYLMGKRSREWIKFKNLLDDDYVICGYILRDNQPVASLVLGQYTASGELKYKGRATIGVKREDFALILQQPVTGTYPFREATPPGTETAVWITPALVCTVQFIARTPEGGIRQPLYKGLRPDKLPQEAIEATGISSHQ